MNPAESNATLDTRPVALWQTTLSAMREDGLCFGKTYSLAWLENQLNRRSDHIGFGAGIAAINDELIEEGYYLSSRNQNGQGYQIVTVENAEAVGDAWGRDAHRRLRRQITILSGLLKNPESKLNDQQKRRLESKQEKAAFKLTLLRRADKFRQLAQQHAPKLITS